MATIEAWSAETMTALQEGTGAIYPMVGMEWLWLIIAVVFWLWWHFKTSRWGDRGTRPPEVGKPWQGCPQAAPSGLVD